MRPYLIALLFASPLPALSQSPEDKEWVCDETSRLAEFIMEAHQDGFPMTDMIGILRDTKTEEISANLVNGYIENLVVPIYSSPRFHTDKAKKRAIANARDTTAADCYKDFVFE